MCNKIKRTSSKKEERKKKQCRKSFTGSKKCVSVMCGVFHQGIRDLLVIEINRWI
jgi:hypothetical protein